LYPITLSAASDACAGSYKSWLRFDKAVYGPQRHGDLLREVQRVAHRHANR